MRGSKKEGTVMAVMSRDRARNLHRFVPGSLR